MATRNKATNKSPSKTKGKSNKSFISNGTNKNISNRSDEMIENPNILRIPLRLSSATNQHDEVINEKRLVEDTYMSHADTYLKYVYKKLIGILLCVIFCLLPSTTTTVVTIIYILTKAH